MSGVFDVSPQKRSDRAERVLSKPGRQRRGNEGVQLGAVGGVLLTDDTALIVRSGDENAR